MCNPGEFKLVDDVVFVLALDFVCVSDFEWSIPGFDHLHTRVEIAKPVGTYSQRNISGIRAVINNGHHLVHLTQRSFDNELVALMQRRKLPECQPTRFGHTTHSAAPWLDRGLRRGGPGSTRRGRRSPE